MAHAQRLARPIGVVRSAAVLGLAVLLIVGLTPAQSAAAADNELRIKIDPALLARVQGDLAGSYAVVVRGANAGRVNEAHGEPQQEKESSDRAAQAVRGAGAAIGSRLSIVGATSANIAGRQILALARDANVARIVPDSVFQVTWEGGDEDGTSRVTTPATFAVNAPQARTQFGLSGSGVGIAVLDSGVAAHPDLGSRVVASVDFVAGDGTISTVPLGDPGGHGTQVAGIIAGDGSASEGAFTGIAPRASIVSVRVIDSTGTTTLSRVLSGMQWIIEHRVAFNIRVLNISFGAPAQSSYRGDLLAAAAETVNFAGVLVVAAAGNAGSAANTILTPGTDPYVLTVGAIDDRGGKTFTDYTVTGWSSRGPTSFDGLAKPDLVAPGRHVVSLRAPGSYLDTLLPDHRITAPQRLVARYSWLSGTSMAAPIVAGTAALLIERYPSITPAQLRYQLKATARPLAGFSVVDQGSGLVDAVGAAALVPTAVPSLNLPVSDAFAMQAKGYVSGQPLTWINLAFNGGVDANGRRWSDVDWTNVSWDGITWQNLNWEAFTWQGITWQGITWQGITWQGVTWQGITWAGITWQSTPLNNSGSNNWEQVN